jgi:propanol-preferring alcohol dehydrogenase
VASAGPISLVEGDLPARRLPIVPGHQAVGRVERVGRDVGDWSVGDRAGVAWLGGACGRCRACLEGRENLCPDARFTGWDRDGGYATRMTVLADAAVRVPDEFSDLDAAPLLCGGAMYRSLRISGIRPGGRLGLFGFGASALLAIRSRCTGAAGSRAISGAGRRFVWAPDGPAGTTRARSARAAITFAPAGDVVVAALGRSIAAAPSP